MRVPGLFITVVLVLVPLAVRSEDGGNKDKVDPVQLVLDRLGKMSPTDQKAFLWQLEHRAGRAAQLTLQPAEAARQEAKARALLHQKTVTWDALGQVIEDTNAMEKEAIRRLARHYQALVFDAFYQQLDVYGQRQQAWLYVYRNWQTAGSRFEQQDLLIDWLEAAIRSVTPKSLGPIPEKPKF